MSKPILKLSLRGYFVYMRKKRRRWSEREVLCAAAQYRGIPLVDACRELGYNHTRLFIEQRRRA